ncbi:MAG: hypothetical protein EOP52_04945 [Sphingobacteriales bacterium]|nr:MAG: hypothetical protein EOP52_04945 [Sphingobacteriales bacterium]
MLLIYGLLILLGLSFIGVRLFIYSRKKKSIIGLIVSLLVISLVICCLFVNTIDQLTISKKDVAKYLKHINIELRDDFEITDNEVTGFPERYQKTQIRVSQRDKAALIRSIVSSDNFRSLVDEQGILKVYTNDYPELGELGELGIVYNLRYPASYIRRAYLRLDTFPTRQELSMYDTTDLVVYRRNED